MDTAPQPLILPAFSRDRSGPRVLPNQFPLLGNELLRVTTANSLAGVRVVVQGRQFNDRGILVPFKHVTTPNSDRSVKTQDFPLSAGAIVNLVAYVEGAAPVRGRTFVQVRIVLGEGADRPLIGTLVQGYVTATQERAWPGSPIENSLDGIGWAHTIFGTGPPAGSSVQEFVPTGARWDVTEIQCQFQTDATVGDRLQLLGFIRSGGPIGASSYQPLIQTASTTVVYVWLQGLSFGAAIDAQHSMQGFARQAPLLAGESFSLQSLLGDSGDDWNVPRYTVIEWLDL